MRHHAARAAIVVGPPMSRVRSRPAASGLRAGTRRGAGVATAAPRCAAVRGPASGARRRDVMRHARMPAMPRGHAGIVVRIALCAAALLAAPPGSPQGVVVAKSDIRFVSRQMGVEVEGRFRRWQANVDWKAQDLAHSKVDLTVELASIDLASEEAEGEVRRAGWFDTAKFPVATFVSSSVKATGADRYEIAGRLAIKGVARDIVVPVQMRRDATGATVALGEFVVKRLAFGIGQGQWADPAVVADDVTVRVRMVLDGGQ
jgi:polyisoprenoid-binding protein YceI